MDHHTMLILLTMGQMTSALASKPTLYFEIPTNPSLACYHCD